MAFIPAPGFTRPISVAYETDDFFEIMRMLQFVL